MQNRWIVVYTMKAPINKIIDFSNVDGPGNRCAIFFQSCPFRCLYCHNPETIRLCVNCGTCVKQCPVQALSVVDGKVIWDDQKCVECDTCIHVCPNLATPKIKETEVDDLVAHIKQVKPFIRGITVSGGECMNQADFLLELFQKVQALGLTCLIDSNGIHDFRKFPELMQVCDGVMLDVKAVDPAFHQELCACDNAMVLKNLDYLLEIGKLEEVRTVILPGKDAENEKTVRYVSAHLQGRSRYKLIRYRPFGVRDAGITAFGNSTYPKAAMEHYEAICRENATKTCVII